MVLLVAGCGGVKREAVSGSDVNDPRLFRRSTEAGGGSILGGNILFGGNKSSNQDAGTGIGVNAFLWRSALDTLSFMPLASADPFGGVIITDWFQPLPGTGERFKATAYILGRQLRADALKLAIFRQIQQGGQWTDAPVNPATVTEIENKMLARARELRAEVAGG